MADRKSHVVGVKDDGSRLVRYEDGVTEWLPPEKPKDAPAPKVAAPSVKVLSKASSEGGKHGSSERSSRDD